MVDQRRREAPILELFLEHTRFEVFQVHDGVNLWFSRGILPGPDIVEQRSMDGLAVEPNAVVPRNPPHRLSHPWCPRSRDRLVTHTKTPPDGSDSIVRSDQTPVALLLDFMIHSYPRDRYVEVK